MNDLNRHIKTSKVKVFNRMLCVFAFLSCFYLKAQEKDIFDYWLDEYNTGYTFLEKEEYTEAILHFNNALNVIDQIDFSTNSETEYYPINNQNNLGICHYKLGEFENATSHFLGTLKQLDALQSSDDAYYNQVLENLLNSYANYDSEKALALRLKIINRLKAAKTDKDLNYAQQLFALAFQYKHLDNESGFYEQLHKTEALLSKLGEIDGDYYAYSTYYLGMYYYQLKNYEKAAILLDKALKLKSYLEHDKDIPIILLYSSYGLSLYNINDFKKAIPLLEKSLQIEEFQTKEFLEFNIVIANLLSICYGRVGKHDLALTTIEKMLETSVKHTSKNGPLYDKALLYAATHHINNSDHKTALKYLNEAERNCKTRNETETSLYASILSKLGISNTYKSNFKIAEAQLKTALKIEEKLNNGQSAEYASNLNSIAHLYMEKGDFTTSEKYYNEALVKLKQFYNEDDITYQDYLISYTNLLLVNESYEAAELILKNALRIYSKHVKKSDLKYVNLLLNIARVYNLKKDYKRALKYYYDAIAILETDKNADNYTYSTAISNLSGVYKDLGDYDNAIKLLLKSFNYTKNTLGINNATYGSIAQNLGQTYAIMSDYDNAKTYYNIALKNLENTVSSDHYYYGILASNMSHLFMKTGQLEKAEELMHLSLENIKRNYGENSTMYTSVQVMEPLLLMRRKKYQEAINVFTSMKPKIQAMYGNNSQFYISVVINEGICNELLGNYDEALMLYKTYYNGFFKELDHVFTYRSEEEKRKFLVEFQGLTAWYNSLALNPNFNTDDILTSSLNKHLVTKGLLINSSKEMIKELKTLKKENINNDIKAFKQSKANLTKNTNKPVRYIDSLKAISNQLELKLIEHYDKYFKINPNFNKDWTKIKSQLKTNEIAIEFSIYKPRKDEDSIRENVYIAYLIHKDWEEPKVVKLFKENNLTALLKNKNPNTLYKTRGSKGQNTKTTTGLYDVIWSPLEVYLKNIETIYFSPSGLLNQIPFAALDTKDKPILASQYNLVQLSSTYALTEEQIQPKTNNTLFIGGINYDYNPTTSEETPVLKVSELSVLRSTNGTRSLGTKWNYLPGTLKEINTIETLFRNKNKSCSSVIAENASETTFKNLSGHSPNVIHIATHGYFFENPKHNTDNDIYIAQDNIYKAAEDPLMRSGLLFSGANYAWQNGGNPHLEDDGVLTALEISNLDLSNTDLVVLSACETGLGDIDGSEGVYGLQRAFKMAGVDLIMMSLWEVPDEETAEFMTIFYNNWLEGQDVRVAFRNTQLEMSATYKDNPEKWAAFVLFE